ncbi:MAG TPA: PAS domain S-box protein [Thermoplasmata archaeon]|nr:PAS domain S-box protein [Thermoplasmata archaeon]
MEELFFCNKKETELFGYSEPYELIGKKVSEFVHKDDMCSMLGLAERIRNSEKLVESVVFRGVKKDGKLVWVEAFAACLSFGGDALLSFHRSVSADEKKKVGMIFLGL